MKYVMSETVVISIITGIVTIAVEAVRRMNKIQDSSEYSRILEENRMLRKGYKECQDGLLELQSILKKEVDKQ